MRSTAGILALCFVLSANLRVLMANPVHMCKMKEILTLVGKEIKDLNSSLKVNHVQHNAEIIHHLVINKSFPIPRQNKLAACGLVYMEKALEQIRDHQRRLNNDEQMQKIFHHIITRLNRDIPHCAHHIWAKCDKAPQPIFPETHFKAKQWTRNFLESSVKFLHQLIDLFENSKKHEEKQ